MIMMIMIMMMSTSDLVNRVLLLVDYVYVKCVFVLLEGGFSFNDSFVHFTDMSWLIIIYFGI